MDSRKSARQTALRFLFLGFGLALFAVGLPKVFAVTLPTGGTVNNQAPNTCTPDDGSTIGSPTNAGNNVTFTATTTDPNGEQYYLAICKSAGITAGDNAAPTCTGGSWAISSATNSGSQATATYTTLTGDTEVNSWVGYVCDKVSGGGLCTATTNTNSPFYVNHRPVIGTVYAGASYGSNSSINPGSTAYFQAAVTDSDSAQPDTISMYICSTSGFTPGSGCTATTICSVTGVASGANAQCNNATLVPIPTAAGSNNYYIFIQDNHNFSDGGTGGSGTYAVTNVAPTLISYSVSGITLSAGASTSPSYTVTISDNNGGSTLTGCTAALYDSGAISLSSGTCTANEKNCYPGVSCSPGTPSGAQLTYTCSWASTPVWFNADYSSSWKMHANPTDGVNSPTGLADSSSISTNALQANDASPATISYGSLALGADSAVQTVTFKNMGNQVLDVLINGDVLTSGSNTIAVSQEKFHETSSTFGWGDTPTAAGPYALVTSSSAGSETTGCLNRDLQVRAVHGTGTEDESIYFILRVPSAQMSGTYSATIYYTAAASNTCSGTLY
jgi:hypothetical protein